MKILISGTDTNITQLISRILTSTFKNCQIKDTTTEKITPKEAGQYRPHIIIFESNLSPTKYDIDFCQKIRHLDKIYPTKILFISPHIRTNIQEEIKNLKNTDTLKNPFTNQQLIQKVTPWFNQ